MHLDQAGLTVAAVAVGVVELGAEHPSLLLDAPFGPGVAAHVIAAARATDISDGHGAPLAVRFIQSEMDQRRLAEPGSSIERLAPRELECLRGVAQHKRSSQIAHDLKLSPKTVDTYIANASRKLGVADRDSAARMLIEHEQRIGGKSLSDFSGVEAEAPQPPTSWLSRLPWPWPTQGRPTNDLTLPQLVIAIGVAAAIMMAIASIYLFAIALLSRGS